MGDYADDVLERKIRGGVPFVRQHPRCRDCGSERVMWLMHKGNWRLCDNETGALHTCAERATNAAKSDFAGFRR